MKKLLILYFSLALFLVASVGKIAVTKGEVFVVRDGESIPAQSGFELMQNDTIKTADGSRAQLVFNDETVVSVGKGSEFVVESYEYEADAGAQAQEASFKSLKGAFKTITGKIGKVAPEKFKLATKTATIGIRGTHFLGKINIDGDKIACTHGAISVAALAGGEPVVVPAGQITSVLAGAMPTPPRKYTAAEINQLNEASGAAPQEGETAPEATGGGSDEGEGQAGQEEGGTAEEQPIIVADDDTVPLEEPPLVLGSPDITSGEPIVPRDVPPQLPTPPEVLADPGGGGEPAIVLPITDGYPMTFIAASGPIDLYGNKLRSGINAPDCEGDGCSISSTTNGVSYFFTSGVQFYRNGTYIAANYDGTGENLGTESEYEVRPLLGFQSFSAVQTDTYTDAQGTLGELGTLSGVQLMDTASGNYGGYNLEYDLNSEETEADYISYDNLGEFAIITSATIDPETTGQAYQSMMYMGVKSSWDFFAGDGTDPDHLIYKLLATNNVGYDASTLDFYSSYYNGLVTGTDYSDSRIIGNTHNANILYIDKSANNGQGWGIVIGSAGIGSSNEVIFDGGVQLWASGEKDSSGYYYIDSDVVIDGVNGGTIQGELYGSQLQGVGFSIANADPTLFSDLPSANPGTFDATIGAGYRTDDAGEINLDTLLTGTATMSGFTASKIYVEGSGSESLGYIDLSLNRDTGSMTGSIKMGEDSAAPDYTVDIAGTGGATSAFISDDYFASILTGATHYTYDTNGILIGETALTPDYASGTAGGFMATNSGFALDDVTWGYWLASYDSALIQFHHKSAWVAGIDTPTTKLDELVAAAGGSANVEVMTYEGKILGRVYGNGPSGTINTDTSWVHIAVDFGSSTPVSGSMAFTVIEYPELVWYVNIDSTGSTLDQSSGAMVALLSANSNSIVTIEADPNSASTDAGGLNADLYGAEGTAIGGNFFATGTIDNSNYLTALGVFKGATDQTLTAPVVGSQKILVGSHVSSWLDSPTGTDGNWREATQTSGSSGSVVDSAVYISLEGDTGTYRNFGQTSYLWTHDGTGFALDTLTYGGSDSGSFTVGTGTTQDVTTMTTAVGGYTGITAEDLTSGDDKKFLVYDNLGDFYILLESTNADANGDAIRSLLYAGTPFESMSSESSLIGYSMVASTDLTITSTELSSGAYSHLLDGDGVLATEANLVLNRSNNKAVFIGTPYENGDGTYTLESMIGVLDQTTGTIAGQGYDVSNGGTSGTVNYGYSTAGATIFGSANQGIGVTLNSPYDLISAAGVRTDTPAGVALTPTTDTDGSTGTVNWVGSLAGVRNAASGDAFEHGIITGLTIDRTNGVVDTTNSTPYLTLGLVSGGVVTTPSEYIDISSATSAYASDDYIAMGFDAAYYDSTSTSFTAADGGGIMVTSPDGVEDDYASWGYWGASYGDPTTTGFEFIPISTWVAGQVASSSVMAALETAGTSMSFSGHVLGYVTTVDTDTSTKLYHAIDTANSVVSLSVDFGTTNPISGSIAFNPTDDTAMAWKMNVGTNTITAANASFDVSSFSTGSGSAVTIGNSELHGNFYSDGSSVTSLGGSLAAGGFYTDSSGNLGAVGAAGVVKATKNP